MKTLREYILNRANEEEEKCKLKNELRRKESEELEKIEYKILDEHLENCLFNSKVSYKQCPHYKNLEFILPDTSVCINLPFNRVDSYFKNKLKMEAIYKKERMDN